MTTDEDFMRALIRLDACEEALTWAATQPDAATAWSQCPRGDWMLWLLGKLAGEWGSESHRRVAFLAALCAAGAWRWMGPESRTAIEVTIRYGQGEEVSQYLLRDAASAARAAWRTAHTAAWRAADAADAATEAAYAAYSATYAASYAYADDAATDAAYAAYATEAAYGAAAYAAYGATAPRAESLTISADLVRLAYPSPPEIP